MTPARHDGPDRHPPRHARAGRGRRSGPPSPGPVPDTAASAGAVPGADDSVGAESASAETSSAEAAGTEGVRSARLGRSSLVMSLGTAASRASGLVRSMLLVACVGATGTVADAFDIGNKLPNMLFALISAGLLQAVLMPQVLRAMNARDSRVRLDKLLTLSGLGLLLLTALLVVAAPLIVLAFTGGSWSDEGRNLAVVFAYWCIPQLFFYGLYMLLGQVLNARGKFGAYGMAPVANNVVSLLGFGAFLLVWGSAPSAGVWNLSDWTTTQTTVMGATATLGIAAQSLVLVVALRRSGFGWRFRLGYRGIGLRSASKIVGWTLGAVVLEQVGILYLTRVLGQGAQAADVDAGEVVAGNFAYTQAMTIYLLPHSLVVVSIITVLFPRMTAAVHRGDLDGVRTDMSLGLRSAGVFSVFSAAVLFVLAAPLTASLLPTAGAGGIGAIAPVLQAMAVGIVALGATVMVRRMYFAFEDGRSIFVIQVIATVSLVVALWVSARVLPIELWAVAAGGSYALSTWVSVLLRIRGMRRKLDGIDGPRVMRLYVRAAVSAVVAGGLGWLVVRLMDGTDLTSWGHALLVTAVAGLVMLAAYVGMLKLLRVRELDDALAPVLRRLRR